MQELDILKYAVNNAEEEVCICDVKGNIIFANNQAIEDHNFTLHYSSYTIYDLKLSDYGYENWEDIVANLRTSGVVRFNVKKELEHGICKVYEVKASIFRDERRDEYFSFFGKEITERIEQENKIKELNYVMEAVLNNIPVYLFVKDPANEFRYIYWNKAFENFSKIPSSKVLGKTDYEVFPNRADAEKFRKDDLTVLHKRSPIEFQEEYIDAEGNKRCVNTLKTLIESDKTLPWVIGVSWDITDMKEKERELIAAKIKAEESDKLKSAFLANMSHEIRTPLNAIVGFSKLLSDVTEEEDRKQYSSIIDNNANLLLQLINDILDISKIEAGTLEFNDSVVDLNEMFNGIYEVHRGRTNESVVLVNDSNPTTVNVRCDHNRLLQVITNLINNAIKFTFKGEVCFGYRVDGEQILFYVRDSGIGIKKDKINDIFNRFIKLNSFIQGTGLGLSICQTIVARMNGTMWVDSEENVGSTFYFTIPYNEENGTGENKKREIFIKKSTKNEKKSILIAEDIDSNYLLIKSIIGDMFTLYRAVDGNDVIDKYNKYHPDLILMDIKMPNKDGLEATAELRKQSDVPIIALTSYAYQSDKDAALKCGCDDFISKPVSVDFLNRVLAKYL